MHIDWTNILCSTDVNLATEMFYSIIYESFEEYVPKRTISITQNNRPWMSKELKRLKNKKNKLFSKVNKNSIKADDNSHCLRINMLFN